MAIDINLVIDSEKKSPQSERIKKLTAISFAFLFFTAFFSLMIFLLNLRFSANAVRQDQQELSNSLSVYDQTASKILIFNNRVTEIAAILDTRKNYTPALERINQIKPEGVFIDNLILDKNAMEITVTSTSLLQLNEFLNSLLDSDSAENVTFFNVGLKSLSAAQNGFTLIIATEIK